MLHPSNQYQSQVFFFSSDQPITLGEKRRQTLKAILQSLFVYIPGLKMDRDEILYLLITQPKCSCWVEALDYYDLLIENSYHFNAVYLLACLPA